MSSVTGFDYRNGANAGAVHNQLRMEGYAVLPQAEMVRAGMSTLTETAQIINAAAVDWLIETALRTEE